MCDPSEDESSCRSHSHNQTHRRQYRHSSHCGHHGAAQRDAMCTMLFLLFSYCSLPYDSNCFSLFRQFKFARSGAVHRDDVAAGSVEMDGNVSNDFVTLLLPLPIPTAMARSVAEPLRTAAHWFCAQSLGSEAVGNLCQNQARQNGENQTKTAGLELCNALSQN